MPGGILNFTVASASGKPDGKHAASCGIRTHDLPLTERVLCQLSYRGHVVNANKTWYLLFYFPMSAKVHALWQPSLWSKFLKAPRELS